MDLTGIPDDERILIIASGGIDLDADDNGLLDTEPTTNQGRIHALAPAAAWRDGGLRINALTDIAWRYSADWVGEVSLLALDERVDEVAQTLLSGDIDGNGQIDADDLLAFDPADASQRDQLRFALTELFLPGGYIEQIHSGGEPDVVEQTLSPLFGAYLSFGQPSQLAEEVTVSAVAFGRGQLTSDRAGLIIDSEQGPDAQAPTIILPRGDNPLTLTATPTADTQILSWDGCDWLSDDLTHCRISLLSNRQVEINFGHRETELKAPFIDLTTATVVWTGDILDVTVDPLDTELLTAMDGIAEGTYVAGLSDVGPFLRKVIGVTVLGSEQWELDTVDATLDEVIAQGTGLLQRALTHGDLAPQALSRSAGVAGPSPVELLPPSGPDDRVFRLRIAPPATTAHRLSVRTGADEILECRLEDPAADVEAGGTLICTQDGVDLSMTGELDIEIDVDWAVFFDSWRIWEGPSYVKIVPEVKATPHLEMSINGALETPTDEYGNDKWRIELATLNFARIKFAIGPVPVWITPQVQVYLGVNGKVEAELAMGVTYSTTMRAGIIYDDGDWEEVKFFEQEFTLDPPPTLAGKAEAKGYVEVSPYFFIYDATGPGLGLEAYLKATAAATLAVQDCPGQLSFGLDGGLGASFKWDTPLGKTKIGELLYLDKVKFNFSIFDWSYPLFAAELNTCDGYVSPPALSVTGSDLHASQRVGESQSRQTQYTLENIGEGLLPWTADAATADSIVTVTPNSGDLAAGEQALVNVSISDTSALPLGTYRNQIQFDNTFTGALNQESHIGSQGRSVRVDVLNALFPSPVLVSATRVADDAVKVSWSFDDPSNLGRGFRLLYSLQPFEQNNGTAHPDQVSAQTRQATFTGLPTSDLYVAIGASGDDTLLQQSFSDAYLVSGSGAAPASYPLNDTGITRCGNASSNNLDCPVSGYPGQDAEFGRDADPTTNDDSDGHAGFSFTKLDANGNALPATATAWSCVRDNVTGLIWEVKTDDGGLRDKGNTYTWYNPDSSTNGGSAGTQNGGSCSGSACDTHAFVQAVNAQGLCGASDWRLPDRFELASIVNADRVNPAIDVDFFPNTRTAWFWSASPDASHSPHAWLVTFYYGYVYTFGKYDGNAVRLVRGGQ